jgi:uncharacterized protein
VNAARSGPGGSRPIDDAERERLEALLASVPAPLEPLDTEMLDGFLCGVIVQPRPVPADRWLACVTDIDGRALPAGFDARELQALVRRRHAELARAIELRAWFDPWVYELDDPGADPSDAVLAWAAGFATALALFPALMRSASPAALEPLALVYRHLDPDDLEDADDLLEAIDAIEPPHDLAEAVEDLVRATLLLADAMHRVVPPAGRGSAVSRRGSPRR